MKASKIKGMPVLSIAEGLRLGTVQDLLLDPGSRCVLAFTIEDGGQSRVLPSDGARHLFRFGDVKAIGQDAITVEHARAVQDPSGQDEFGGLLILNSLMGLKVVDTTGTLLGKVEEIEIAPDDGRVVELTVARGGVLGLGGNAETVTAEAIRSLGPQIVMVEPTSTPPVNAEGAGAVPAT